MDLPVPLNRIGEVFFRAHGVECSLKRCRTCGLAFVNPRPAASVLAEFYDQPGYAAHPEADDAFRWAVVNARIAKLPQPVMGGRALDVGCGNGLMLEACRRVGWTCVGMDPSVHGRAVTAGRGFPVYESLQHVVLHEAPFDMITLYHVLEHVADLDEFFLVVRPLLKRGGRLVIEVPNIKSFRVRAFSFLPPAMRRDDDPYRAFPIHLYGFSCPSIKALLQQHQFRLIQKTTSGLGIEWSRRSTFSRTDKREVNSDQIEMPLVKSNWRRPARFIWSIMERFGWGENLTVTAEVIPK